MPETEDMCLFFDEKDDPYNDKKQDMETDEEVAALLASFSSIDAPEQEQQIYKELQRASAGPSAAGRCTPIKFNGFTPIVDNGFTPIVDSGSNSPDSMSGMSEDDLLGNLNMSIDQLVSEMDGEDQAADATLIAEVMRDLS